MQVINVAVLLFGYPAGQQLEVPDKDFYQQLFFNPSYGLAAYWLKQTGDSVLLDGQVLDWAWVNDPNPTLTSRTDVLNSAIKDMEQDRRIIFAAADVVILVLGVPDNVQPDGGSCTAQSFFRNHHGIVGKIKDRFDFFAHEIGHALGLQHSFGDWTYKNSSYSQHGEYGHPFCIMSAMGYGGTAGSLIPASPREKRPEYTGLGPSVNAATAVARGWLTSAVYDLQGAHSMEILLRSRQWGDMLNNFGALPQALDVRARDGQNYVLEYRENSGWDEGHASALIINHGRGSTADQANPNTNSGTFLKVLSIPFTFGSASNIYNGPGFAIEVLERSQGAHTLRFRIAPGHIAFTELKLTASVDILGSTVLETGDSVFAPGETWCVEGSWHYDKRARTQVSTLECTYALAIPPITSTWHIDGHALSLLGGTIVLQNKRVTVANAKLHDASVPRDIELRYEVAVLPTGARLRLFNRPEDETFSVDVAVSLATDIGSGSTSATIKFEGIKYEYPPDFYTKRNACMYHIDPNLIPQYKVALSPDDWHRVPEERFHEVSQLLNKLATLVDATEKEQYNKVLSVLKSVLSVDSLKARIVPAAPRLDASERNRSA
jgi:hypothetical protein